MIKDLTPETLEEGKAFIKEQRITILRKSNIEEKLYIEVESSTETSKATVIILAHILILCMLKKMEMYC